MPMTNIVSWILAVWWLALNVESSDNIINRFIVEATQRRGIGSVASKINLFSCSERGEIHSLIEYASENYVAISVMDISRPFDLNHLRKSIDLQLEYQVLDLDCPGAGEVLRKANSIDMFVGPNRWLLLRDLRVNDASRQNELVDLSDENRTTELFEDFGIYPDSDVVIGERIERDFVRLISIYRPSPVRKMLIEDRGYWTEDSGIRLNSAMVASARRKDLQRTPLKSCLVVTNPDTMNHLTDFQDTHIDPIAKANLPWVLSIVEMMNATVSFAVEPTWGYRSPNGTWSGMIGMLDRKEIDLGGTASFLTAERIGVVEYILLCTPTKAKFILRRPSLSYVSNVFSLTFRPSVWLASGVFLVLVTFLLYVTATWEWKSATVEERERSHWAGTMLPVTWSENLLVILGAVFQQGSKYEPRRVPPRIIILMLFLAVLSLHTSYTANIVALLQSSTNSIKDLDTLLRSSLGFGVHDTVYNRYYFAAAKDPVREAIYTRKVVPKGKKPAWMDVDEGVRRLREGLFAFHGEIGPIYKRVQETFLEGEKCGLREIDYLNVVEPMLSIPKKSPYSEIIRVGALKIHETGLRSRFVARIYMKRPVCHGQSSFVSVGLIDCFAAFAALAYGLALSLFVVTTEILWFKRCANSTDDGVSHAHSEIDVATESQVQEIT